MQEPSDFPYTPNNSMQPFDFKPKQQGGKRLDNNFQQLALTSTDTNDFTNNSSLPLVSIITVVFNGKKYLEQTIQSVINQTYDNIEYIIIDGGSTDGTLDIIRKYEEVIDYWVSEPDDGLYDAMNKGIQLVTGEIIGIINSDDWYIKDAISKVVEKYINCQHKKVIICGSMYRTDSNGQIKLKLQKSAKYLVDKIKWTIPVNHPATFVEASVYATIGMFEPKYKICSDYDLIYKAYYDKNINFILIDDCLACMTIGGLSEKFRLGTVLQIAKEHYQIRKKNTFWFNNLVLSLLKILVKLSKYTLNYLIPNQLTAIYYRYRHNNS